jgi:hypothetical protein
MTIDSTYINAIIAWARLHAPTQNAVHGDSHGEDGPYRRRVRLEISAEEHRQHPIYGFEKVERIVCRVYLAERTD